MLSSLCDNVLNLFTERKDIVPVVNACWDKTRTWGFISVAVTLCQCFRQHIICTKLMFTFISFSDSSTALRWRAYALGLLNTGWTSTALFLQAALLVPHWQLDVHLELVFRHGQPVDLALFFRLHVFLQRQTYNVRASLVLVLKVNIGRNVYYYFEADKCKAGMISYHTSDNSADGSGDWITASRGSIRLTFTGDP